jgi:protein-tyrosine phosphatase
MSPSPLENSFAVLLVCTGNICRSPVGERLLQQALGTSVTASSAGTYAVTGNPIAPQMAALLRDAAVDDTGFAAHQLSEGQARGADLVLTMTRDHRAAVVDLWPASVRRAFTLREFARLLRSVEGAKLDQDTMVARLAAAVPLAAGQRHQLNAAPETDDIADPYGGPEQGYRATYTEINAAVRSIAGSVGALTTGPDGVSMLGPAPPRPAAA